MTKTKISVSVEKLLNADIRKLKKNKPNIDSKVDIKNIDTPNICFSISRPEDEHEESYKIQRILRGFDDSETWALHAAIACFILPRLERYVEITNSIIKKSEKEKKELKCIITSMKLIMKDRGGYYSEAEDIKIQKGLDLLPKIFMSLWW